jgi:hypothetical protein
MAGSNNIAYVPPVDSVQEFKIQTNSYDSQYGHTGGGIINVSLKSGTNQLHGTVYEFARRKGWDANSFQNNAQRLQKDAHYLDQFGWQVEGPILVPKIYDGRNKSFFMFNYEGYREGTPRPQTLSVPAKEFLDGDFSKNVTGRDASSPSSIRDGPRCQRVWTREPFAGNRIPQNGSTRSGRTSSDSFLPQRATAADDYTVNNYFFAGRTLSTRIASTTSSSSSTSNSAASTTCSSAMAATTARSGRSTTATRLWVRAQRFAAEKRINDAYVWIGSACYRRGPSPMREFPSPATWSRTAAIRTRGTT